LNKKSNHNQRERLREIWYLLPMRNSDPCYLIPVPYGVSVAPPLLLQENTLWSLLEPCESYDQYVAQFDELLNGDVFNMIIIDVHIE
jgi:hypothetical protein